MAAPTTQNPAIKPESKSAAKKKKAKTPSGESEPTSVVSDVTNGTTENSSGDGTYESPYIKELYKSIRNVNKKITNASKVDNVVADNPGMTLDELVAARKINADQKAQILKKPSLQASLTQLEEQISQYKKFDQEYKAVSQAEKVEFEKTLIERANKEREEAVAVVKAECEAASVQQLHDNLLTLTKFLQLAAIRRLEEDRAEEEENKALEGLLTEVYSGNDNAVTHMLKLMKSSPDKLRTPQGDELNVTYADIQVLIQEMHTYAGELEPADEEDVTPHSSNGEYSADSDATLVNAGLTEMDAPPMAAMTNGHAAETFETAGVPQNASIGEGVANAVAEAHWDPSNEMTTSQEWVEVPRDAAETETGLTATPAAPSNVQSWADDQPDSPSQVPAPVNPNDGFQDVTRNRDRGGHNRGNFRGYRGRGGDGSQRGRGGYRGDGNRGRGPRGGGNSNGGGNNNGGGNGGQRGPPRRSDES